MLPYDELSAEGRRTREYRAGLVDKHLPLQLLPMLAAADVLVTEDAEQQDAEGLRDEVARRMRALEQQLGMARGGSAATVSVSWRRPAQRAARGARAGRDGARRPAQGDPARVRHSASSAVGVSVRAWRGARAVTSRAAAVRSAFRVLQWRDARRGLYVCSVRVRKSLGSRATHSPE